MNKKNRIEELRGGFKKSKCYFIGQQLVAILWNLPCFLLVANAIIKQMKSRLELSCYFLVTITSPIQVSQIKNQDKTRSYNPKVLIALNWLYIIKKPRLPSAGTFYLM